MRELPFPSDGSVNANPPGMSFRALVREDFETHGRDWTSQGFWAVFWHRFGNWRMSVRRPFRAPLTVIYRVMFKAGEILGGISLPYSVPIGRRVRIEHFGGIVISARHIGSDVIIRQNTTFGIASVGDRKARPVVLDRVDIGVGAVIIGAVTVGNDVTIGANAVVTRDIPDNSVAVGVPARVVRRKDAARPVAV